MGILPLVGALRSAVIEQGRSNDAVMRSIAHHTGPLGGSESRLYRGKEKVSTKQDPGAPLLHQEGPRLDGHLPAVGVMITTHVAGDQAPAVEGHPPI